MTLIRNCFGCGRKKGKPNTWTKKPKQKMVPAFLCSRCQKSFQEEYEYEMKLKLKKLGNKKCKHRNYNAQCPSCWSKIHKK